MAAANDGRGVCGSGAVTGWPSPVGGCKACQIIDYSLSRT